MIGVLLRLNMLSIIQHPSHKWYKEMGAKQADLISGMVMRFRGSTSSIFGMRSLAPGDRWLGRL